MRTNLPVTQNQVELKDSTLIVSRTDLQGRITYINKDFIEISGFTEAELIGEPHNIVRHPDMPAEAFEDFWSTLKEGRPWTGYVKNRCKNGDYYWVIANATPIWENGQMTGYLSVRRKVEAAKIGEIDEVYRKFREKKQGKLRIHYGQVVSGGEGMFSKLNLAGRMSMVLGGLGLIVACVMAFALMSLARTNENVDALYTQRFEPVRIVGRIGKLMADNRAQILLGLQHDPASPFSKLHDHPITIHADTVSKNIAEITTLWEEYQKSISTPEHRALADAYAAARKIYVQEGLLPARKAQLDEAFTEANMILLQKINPSYNAASEKADALYKFHNDNARADQRTAEERYRTTFMALTAAFVALLGIGIFAAWRMINSIRRPIEFAIDTFRNITQGIYSNVIDISRDDEFGKLNQGLQSMQTRLGFEVAETKRQADEMTRIKIALDNVSTGVMIANSERTIIYTNRSVVQVLKGAESAIRTQLPDFSADNLVGQNIDLFHKNPKHQADMLARLNTVHTAKIEIGGRHLVVSANPVLNDKGERLGSVAEWQDRTAEVNTEREVDQLVAAAAQGDLSQRIDLSDKTGFFASLGGGLNQLLGATQQALETTSDALGRVARGDLTRTIDEDFSGIFGQLKDDTNTTVERLREVVGRIKEASEAINTASQEIAAGNTDLSSRTEEQASSLEETASSMEELNATVRQNAESARQGKELSQQSNDAVVRGGQMVKQVVTTMSGIQNSSKKIADIIGVIDSIAFQTNILALNAAVEAARAGEQGRGFAVVATEVRNLAQRSATAAKEIKSLIAESVDQVESGAKLVHQAGDTMDEVVVSFQRVATLVTEIANASREQASGIEQVTQAVGQMDEVTQQNAALVEEAAAAAESLEEQSRGLVQAVSMFTLLDGDRSHRGNNLPGPALRDATPRQIAGASAKVGAGRTALRSGNPPANASKNSGALAPPRLASDDEEWEEF